MKKEKNVYVESIQDAQTDNQKAALLIRWKKEMPAKEFEDLKTFMIGKGLIGPGVGMQMLFRDLREKYPAKTKNVPDMLKLFQEQRR